VNRSVGWVEQRETQLLQPEFLVLPLDDINVGSATPFAKRLAEKKLRELLPSALSRDLN
jgi:hypothetical protein